MLNQLIIREGKELNIGDVVHIYYNLHKGGYSIRKNGIVVAYAKDVPIQLKDAEFRVQQKPRLEIIKKQRKGVCAYVKGTFVGCEKVNPEDMREIYFNPYTTEQFLLTDTQEQILEANWVHFENKRAYTRR